MMYLCPLPTLFTHLKLPKSPILHLYPPPLCSMFSPLYYPFFALPACVLPPKPLICPILTPVAPPHCPKYAPSQDPLLSRYLLVF